MLGTYKSMLKKHMRIIKIVLVVTVCFLTIGFSSFTSQLGINGLTAQVRIQRDIRIKSIAIDNVTGNALSNGEDYNVDTIVSGITLPNANSTITYNIEIVNIGNTEAVLRSITGIPENLELTLNNYTLNDKICDDDDATLCKLSATKTLSLTIGYKNNGFNANSVDYNVELDFEFAYMVDAIAKINDVFYDSLVEAVADVPTDNTQTTIMLLKDTSELINITSNKNIILNLNNNTLSNMGSANVIINYGTLLVQNGTISSNVEQGAINNESSGVLTIDGARIIVSGRQTIYNNGGRVTINEYSYLKSSSTTRAALQNLASGVININGGSIISTGFSAIINAGTLTIGAEGGNVSTTSPVIRGKTYGIDNTSTKTPIYFYDGVLQGKTKAIAAANKITAVEDGYDFVTTNETIEGENYEVSYLVHAAVVTFNPDGGNPEFRTKKVIPGHAIGTLPTVTRTGYLFLGWFDGDNEVTENTIINADIAFTAHWQKLTGVARIGNNLYDTLQLAINAAGSSPVTIQLLKNTSEAITINSGKKITLDIGEYTLSNSGNKAVIENKGDLTIISGTIRSTASTGAINAQAGSVTITGGNIIAAGNRQALYITGGTATISGNAYLSSATDGAYNGMDRSTVQVVAGTLYITGGTIEASKQHAVGNAGTLIIGVKDGTIDTSLPMISGKINGVKNTGTFNFYDGTIKGMTSAINGTVTEIEDNSTIIETMEDTYNVKYLNISE